MIRPTSSMARNLVCSYSSSSRAVSGQDFQFPKSHKWNRAVSQAENLVGFPTSLLSLRTLMSDDVTSMASHMRKLMGSDHPVLKTLKRLTYHEKNHLQVRGLILLLLARAFNNGASKKFSEDSEFDEKSKILLRQRKLAEYIEMIYSAQNIHRSVLNLPNDFHEEPESEEKDDLLLLEYGNKIAILGGDYLLANACTGLASLRNTYIVEMISKAIADFTQSEFLGPRDIQVSKRIFNSSFPKFSFQIFREDLFQRSISFLWKLGSIATLWLMEI